jgi:hypothetical protein
VPGGSSVLVVRQGGGNGSTVATSNAADSPLTLVAAPTMLSAVRCAEELPQSPAQPLCCNREEKRHEGADHVPRCGPSGF